MYQLRWQLPVYKIFNIMMADHCRLVSLYAFLCYIRAVSRDPFSRCWSFIAVLCSFTTHLAVYIRPEHTVPFKLSEEYMDCQRFTSDSFTRFPLLLLQLFGTNIEFQSFTAHFLTSLLCPLLLFWMFYLCVQPLRVIYSFSCNNK